MSAASSLTDPMLGLVAKRLIDAEHRVITTKAACAEARERYREATEERRRRGGVLQRAIERTPDDPKSLPQHFEALGLIYANYKAACSDVDRARRILLAAKREALEAHDDVGKILENQFKELPLFPEPAGVRA